MRPFLYTWKNDPFFYILTIIYRVFYLHIFDVLLRYLSKIRFSELLWFSKSVMDKENNLVILVNHETAGAKIFIENSKSPKRIFDFF